MNIKEIKQRILKLETSQWFSVFSVYELQALYLILTKIKRV